MPWLKAVWIVVVGVLLAGAIALVDVPAVAAGAAPNSGGAPNASGVSVWLRIPVRQMAPRYLLKARSETRNKCDAEVALLKREGADKARCVWSKVIVAWVSLRHQGRYRYTGQYKAEGRIQGMFVPLLCGFRGSVGQGIRLVSEIPGCEPA